MVSTVELPVTELPNVTVQILPVSAGVYPVTSEAFLHLAVPDGERDIVYIETTIDNRMLEEYDLTWFEEPLPAWDLDGLARVAATLDTPIASGETEYTRYGFRRMIELRSADILMPDLQRVGGVSEFMRVGHMAESYDVGVSSHLFPETSIQVLGGLSNSVYLEYMPWFSPLYNEALTFLEGQALVPERPGWGFTFNQDYIAHLEACA